MTRRVRFKVAGVTSNDARELQSGSTKITAGEEPRDAQERTEKLKS
jgi:hypothetical protein